jgi:Response regulator containing CheY-like receiver, AAA-type ATPase, and DNA-binding domains
MYTKINQLLELGFSKSQTAKKLGISRPTLYKYLSFEPKEMLDWIDSTKTRKKN